MRSVSPPPAEAVDLHAICIEPRRRMPTPPPHPSCISCHLVHETIAISLFSSSGMLCRLLLGRGTQIAFDGSHGLFGVLPANLIGCFLFGALCDGKALAATLRSGAPEADAAALDAVSSEPLPIIRGTPTTWSAILLGLRTGFCGSLTSYSSWNQAMVYYLLVQQDGRAFAIAAVIGLLAPFAALVLGQRAALWSFLALRCTLQQSPSQSEQPESGAQKIDSVLDDGATRGSLKSCSMIRIAVCKEAAISAVARTSHRGGARWLSLLLLIGVIASVAAIAATTGDDESMRICVAVLLAPVGALLRWRLSKALNGRYTRAIGARGLAVVFSNCSGVPIGTLAANLLASILAALLLATVDSGAADGRSLSWRSEAALRGIVIGFCGCLSTVSTFINEVQVLLSPSLRSGSGYHCSCSGLIYPLVTLCMCLALAIPCYGWAIW